MINVEFGENKFTMTSDTCEDLYNAIRDLLLHIRTNNELKNIFTIHVEAQSSKYGALCRYNEFATQQRHATRDLKVLRDLITFGKTSFSLSNLSQKCVHESINDIIAIIQLLGTVKVLDLVCIDPSADFFPKLNSDLGIEFLRFECENRKNFVNFLKKLTTANDDVLSGLGFRYTKLDRSGLNIVKEIVQKKALKCLEFESSIRENDVEYFIVEILPSLQSLISLSLNNVSNLLLQPVLEKCPHVRFLSLKNCGLYVDESLKLISKYGNIHRVDLSGNIGTLKSGLEFPLSTTLREVVLDKCTFEDESLQHIFCFLLENLPRKSVLSARSIQASDVAWNASLPVISKMRNCQITGLIWDGNRVSADFLTFIENLEKLTHLSMSGCFSANDEDLVDQFALIVRYSKLKTLVCRGTEERYLDELLIRVLVAVGASKSLTTVDLRGNRGSSVYIGGITSIVDENVTITKLAFDGIKPDDGERFVDFLHDVSHYKIKENLSFPINDISDVLSMENEERRQEIYEQLISAFTIPSPDDYVKPVRVFLYDSEENHPYYLTENAAVLLHDFPTEDSYRLPAVLRLLKKVRRNSSCEIKMGVPEIVQDIIDAGNVISSAYGVTIKEAEMKDFKDVELMEGDSIKQSLSIPVTLVRKYNSCVIEKPITSVAHVEELVTPEKVIRRVVKKTVVRTSRSPRDDTNGFTKTPIRRLIKKRIKVISKSARKRLTEDDIAALEKKNKLKMKKLAAETPRKPFVRYTPPRTRQREEIARNTMDELTEGQMEVKAKIATPIEIKARSKRRLLAQNA